MCVSETQSERPRGTDKWGDPNTGEEGQTEGTSEMRRPAGGDTHSLGRSWDGPAAHWALVCLSVHLLI